MSPQALVPRIGQANALVCSVCRASLPQHPTTTAHARVWFHRGATLQRRARPGTIAARRASAKKQAPPPLPEGNIEAPDHAVTYTKAPLPEAIHNYDEGEDKGYTVRYFEQDEHGVVKQLRNQKEFSQSWSGGNDPMAQRAKQLLNTFSDSDVRMPTKGEVDHLAEEITDISESGAPPETIIQKLGRFVRGLSSPRELQASTPDTALRGIIEAAENETITQIDERWFKGLHKQVILRLNKALQRFAKPLRRGDIPPAATFSGAYRRYLDARVPLALNYDKIHKDVWNLMWKAFSIEHENNPKRLIMLSKLARDMSLAKVELPPDQQLVTIEVMFSEGYHDHALQVWKKNVSTLGDSNAPTYQAYWELGARMHCLIGDLERAEDIVSRILKDKSDPRILIDVIHAALAQETPQGAERAWSAYRQMRELLGDKMSLVDFDRIISLYLAVNRLSDALNIFVDMMTKGAVTIDSADRIPMIIANKFFMGKWLKRLIGNGELESALKVVRFMQEHNIPSSAIQLNGLIGAWQRSGSSKDLLMADHLAWEMVRSRLEFVLARHGENKQYITDADRSHGMPLPPANLETFSLLAEDYQLRHLDDKLQKLWDTFDACEIPYNAFMMNQLMANSLDFGRVEEALSLYRTLVTEKGMKPNSHTFIELWKALEVNRVMLLSEDQRDIQVTAARRTFGEMIRHIGAFEGEPLNYQLGRKILHTFRRLEDRPGFVIALSMLRRYFAFLPLETLVLELVVGSTNLVFDSPYARHKVRLAKAKMETQLWEMRKRAKGDSGQDRLTEEIPEEERKELLFAYLRDHFLHGTPGAKTELVTEEVLNEVAKDMGLFDAKVEEYKDQV